MAAAVAALAAAVWFVLLPEWRPGLRAGERFGIDVSHHQGAVDWRRVAGDRIRFAYVKATEGRDHVDARFQANWRGAQAAGLQRGAYHFFTLCSPGVDQADNFLAVVPPEHGTLPPAVDLELVGNCSARPPRAAVARELDAFLAKVEAAWGRPALLYVGDEFEGPYPVRARLGRPLWHRRFLRRPNVEGWAVWQLHGEARVHGVRGRVDLNVMRAGWSGSVTDG